MKSNFHYVAVALALAASPAAAASDACAPLAALVRQARNDFSSLKQKRLAPGKCAFRDREFRCEWAFAGDAYGIAEDQSAGLAQCAVAQSREAPTKTKRNETVIALERDLSLIVGPPQMESGDWTVSLRMVEDPGAN